MTQEKFEKQIRSFFVSDQLRREFGASCKMAGKTQAEILRELVSEWVRKNSGRPVDSRKGKR